MTPALRLHNPAHLVAHFIVAITQLHNPCRHHAGTTPTDTLADALASKPAINVLFAPVLHHKAGESTSSPGCALR